VFERFFDEAAACSSSCTRRSAGRVNRGFGLALRSASA